jgi:FkbM family methyltransferase
MSYSQGEEEGAILAAFQGKPVGRALDIGAWNPTTFSNSRALYELGWELVLIEPSPTPMTKLLEVYGNDPRVKIIQAAFGVAEFGDSGIQPSLLRMQITDDAVSTAFPGEYEKWKHDAAWRGAMWVPQITFQQIGNWLGGFNFINIDTEGNSVDIFKEMIRVGWRPQCVCVEHNDRLPELLQCATFHEYKASYCDGNNVVLVR